MRSWVRGGHDAGSRGRRAGAGHAVDRHGRSGRAQVRVAPRGGCRGRGRPADRASKKVARAGRSEQHSPFVAVAEVLPPKREAKAAQLGIVSCVTGWTCAWRSHVGSRVARAVRSATMVCTGTRENRRENSETAHHSSVTARDSSLQLATARLQLRQSRRF